MGKRNKSRKNKYIREQRKILREMSHPEETAVPDPKLKKKTEEEEQEGDIRQMELKYGYAEVQDEKALREYHRRKFSEAHTDLDDDDIDPTGGSLIVDTKYVEGNKPRYEEISDRWPML